ncbi:Type II secretion system (T2SS), protein F [uncultured archaeon]|nr:Type II secretion system (T2SS), protein F [uncultured archaeon]
MPPYELFARVFPSTFKKRFKQLLIYSGLDITPERFLGFSLFIGLALAYILTSVINAYISIPFIGIAIVLFAVIEFLLYLWLQLSADNKAKMVDEALPDALQLMSSNIRAGLTTDKALLMAARPEFGPLADEIKRIGKETMAGRPLAEALLRTSQHVRSVNLERSIDLIVRSMQSGGELADLLDQTANDIRDQQLIQKEITASVLMYVMFIAIAIGLGAPVLFALSGFLVKLLTTNMTRISAQLPKNIGGKGYAAPIAASNIQITPDFINLYSVVAIISGSILGSMAMGLILKGEEKEGLKYIPVLLILSLSIYYMVGWLISTVLGGIMNM